MESKRSLSHHVGDDLELGYKELKEALEEAGIKTVTAGDCAEPGRIPTSLRSGAEAAYHI